MPSSQRHDILYHCARNVLNQNIKRVFFKLNPFLERTDKPPEENPSEIKVDIPNTKFVLPLQSLVTCEQYFFDEVLFWREFTNDEFWRFLFSEDWKMGFSLRVFEGQLLDNLLMVLHVLEREGAVNRCRTFAYARNSRKRPGCYKFSTEPLQESIEETLLLEFNYYYHCPPTVQHDAHYPSEITSEEEYGEDSKTISETQLQQAMNRPRRKSKGMVIKRTSFHRDAKTCEYILEEEEEEEEEEEQEEGVEKEVTNHSKTEINVQSTSVVAFSAETSQLEVKSTNSIAVTGSDMNSASLASTATNSESENSQLSTESSATSSPTSPSLINLRNFRCTEKTPLPTKILQTKRKWIEWLIIFFLSTNITLVTGIHHGTVKTHSRS
ncbi:hypothetical protein ScPMuIL_004759 [Solemya velum]